MSQDDRNPISVIALRAVDFSPDGEHVVISLTTKFSTRERIYSVPVACLRDLVVDLRRLNAADRDISIETHIQSTDTTDSAENIADATATELA
jgi:hypothetical protein